MIRACIGLGSNLGMPHTTLIAAAEAIEGLRETTVVGRSAIYESEPVGPGVQNPYLNAAVQITTSLSARVLLSELQGIENAAGRERRERWGPRTLDLDLLLYGSEIMAEADLTVPHPRIRERNFVLAPLQDLLGGETRITGERIADLLDAAPANGLVRTALSWGRDHHRDCA